MVGESRELVYNGLLAVRFVLDDKGAARYETADVGEIPVRAVDAIDSEDWRRAVRHREWTAQRDKLNVGRSPEPRPQKRKVARSRRANRMFSCDA